MKKTAITILKSFLILIGLLVSAGTVSSFGVSSSYASGAEQAGAMTGNLVLLAIGLALMILPAISLYKTYRNLKHNNK